MVRTKLTFEKVFDDGELRLTLIKVEGCLPKKDLPREYLEGYPNFFLYAVPAYPEIHLMQLVKGQPEPSHRWITVGASVEASIVYSFIKQMKMAGERLTRINQYARAKNWHGIMEVVI
jgi:hypothetical protein